MRARGWVGEKKKKKKKKKQKKRKKKKKERDWKPGSKLTCEVDLGVGVDGAVPERRKRLLIQSVEPVILEIQREQCGETGQDHGRRMIDPGNNIILKIQVSQMDESGKGQGANLLDPVAAEIQAAQLGHVTEGA